MPTTCLSTSADNSLQLIPGATSLHSGSRQSAGGAIVCLPDCPPKRCASRDRSEGEGLSTSVGQNAKLSNSRRNDAISCRHAAHERTCAPTCVRSSSPIACRASAHASSACSQPFGVATKFLRLLLC